jgi:hypothetical protein
MVKSAELETTRATSTHHLKLQLQSALAEEMLQRRQEQEEMLQRRFELWD